MKCRELTGFVEACLDAYVDGELDDRDCGELEAHLAECEVCCEAVRTQARLKAVLRRNAQAVKAPEHLLSRISQCLDSTDLALLEGRSDVLDDDEAVLASKSLGPARGHYLIHPTRQGSSPVWRSMPLFASVAFLLVFVWISGGGFAHDPLIDDAVRKHVRSLPLEVTGPPESLEKWLRDKVEFNPEVLVFHSGLEPLGARLSHVRDHPAIYVGYGRPGSGPDGERQVSLIVFSAPSFDPTAERHRHRRVGRRNMIVTQKSGYNVVVWKEKGVVYSLISDLDERELLGLIHPPTQK